MSVPIDLKYTREHEWLRIDGDLATVGITAYAAEALGDVVFVDLPTVGAHVEAGEPCGELESTKSVSDLFAPSTGEVVGVNEAVSETPSLINEQPFGEGWLFTMRLQGPPELLDAAAYERLCEA